MEELGRDLFPRDDDDDEAFDSDSTLIAPVPVLIGAQTARSWLTYPFRHANQVPWGLYLDACDPGGPCPFEDGSRLALPFPLGQNGYARTADGSSLPAPRVHDGHTELYQLGQNPFISDHSSQLLATLLQFVGHIRQGMWQVGVDGVEGGADVFRQADTDMAAAYRLVFVAGNRFW